MVAGVGDGTVWPMPFAHIGTSWVRPGLQSLFKKSFRKGYWAEPHGHMGAHQGDVGGSVGYRGKVPKGVQGEC